MITNESASYTMSAKFLKTDQVLKVTVTREGAMAPHYPNGIPYQWKFVEEVDWKDGNLNQPWQDQQMTYVCHVPAPERPIGYSGLLQLRLKTDDPQKMVFVYLGQSKMLRYWTQCKNGNVLLYMQSESGKISTTGLYLKYGSNEMRFPLPYEEIGQIPCLCKIKCKDDDVRLEADLPESLCVKFIQGQR